MDNTKQTNGCEKQKFLWNKEMLRHKAEEVRYDVIDMISHSSKGHPGGALSAADIVTTLYFYEMRVNPDNPKWDNRDRFILSKGHACPVLYSVLAERGFFDKSELRTLRKLNSHLQGHPDMNKTPGIDMSSGSLGQGLSVGLGMALSAKLMHKDYHIWVLLGDGELQEGSVWEAAMAASKWQTNNLTAIVDMNGLQSDGKVDDKMSLQPISEKWKSFGWEPIEIDGHDIDQIIAALDYTRNHWGKPKVIIAHTIKGKGVSFMENVTEWHGKAPTMEEAEKALNEIRSRL